MAGTPQQAEARRQLRARGEQLAPRAGTSVGRPAAGADTAEAITGVPVRRATQRRAASSTARRTRSTGGRPGSTAGRRGGRRGGAPTRPGAFQRGGYVERQAVRQFRATSRVLVVELVIALALVALRPSEPTPGSDGQTKASQATIPQLLAVMVVFLLLAAVGSAGPRPQRAANLFGGLLCVGLAFKNHAHLADAVKLLAVQEEAAPDMAPEVGNAPGQVLPTPTGTAADLGLGQQVVSGWRGSAPQATGTTQAPGTTTAGGRG